MGISAAGGHGAGKANKKFRGSKKQHSIPNAHVRSQIKNLEQVRKEREKKANRISYMKSKSAKGKNKKFGRKKGKPK